MKVENYKMVRLGDVCEIVNGFAFDSKLFNTEKKGTPLIRIRDVIRGFSETYTTETADSRFLIKSGDLLIGMDGEFNCSLWKSEDSFLNQRVCKIVPNEDLIHKDYVYYGLQGKLKEIEDKTAFVTVKHISSKQIENIILKQPPLETQKHIAAVLDKCTSVIAKHREMLAKYDTLIKSRFIEMFENISSDNWKIVSISDVCSNTRTGPFGSALHHDEFVDRGVFVLGIDNAVQNKFSYKRMRYITKEKYETLKRYTVYPEDIIITIMGTIGRSAVIPKDFPLAINTKHLACLTVNKEFIDPIFLCSAFQIHTMIRSQLKLKTKGAIMDGLNLGIIRELRFPLPPLSLQRRFAAFVQQIDKSKFAVQKSLDKAETLYKALMQEYFGA